MDSEQPAAVPPVRDVAEGGLGHGPMSNDAPRFRPGRFSIWGYLSSFTAFTIFTIGSSIWPRMTPSPLVGEVGAARMALTTSWPSTTRPKAAKPGWVAVASNAGMSVVMMKKSLFAMPGPLPAMAIDQAVFLIPVWLVGSCWTAG